MRKVKNADKFIPIDQNESIVNTFIKKDMKNEK